MERFVRATIHGIDTVARWSGNVFGWISVILMLIMVHHVVMRYVFGEPTFWAYELSYMLYGSMFMLGAAYTLYRQGHIRTDFLYRHWSPRTQGILDTLFYVVCFFPAMILPQRGSAAARPQGHLHRHAAVQRDPEHRRRPGVVLPGAGPLAACCSARPKAPEDGMITAHADVVGSLLRPPWLLAAQGSLRAGGITRAAYKRIEDRAVDEAVAVQEAAGLAVVTDGEMRRLSFQSQMVQAVEGFGEWDLDAFLWGEWHGDEEIGDWRGERPQELAVVAPLRRHRSLCAEEFVYLRARTGRIAKVTLPSPGLFANFWSAERSRDAYPSLVVFLEAVARILREEVEELAAYGASYIQLDAPHYPLLLEPKTRAFYEAQGWSTEQWLDLGVALDNLVMAAIDGVTFGLHLCRGNQASRWLVAGDYGPIAGPIFRGTAAQRLLLEYDDARSGGFEPLRQVPDDKMAVLGLITTKRGELEDADQLVGRIGEASRHLERERLALSPQCGFGTSILGNRLTPEAQAAKLRLVCEVAARVWG